MTGTLGEAVLVHTAIGFNMKRPCQRVTLSV